MNIVTIIFILLLYFHSDDIPSSEIIHLGTGIDKKNNKSPFFFPFCLIVSPNIYTSDSQIVCVSCPGDIVN